MKLVNQMMLHRLLSDAKTLILVAILSAVVGVFVGYYFGVVDMYQYTKAQMDGNKL